MTAGVPFWKYYAEGNSYVVVDGADDVLDRVPDLLDPRRGLGADGVLVSRCARDGSVMLRIFNADGSEAPMCGNGARCVAALAISRGDADPERVVVRAAGGTVRHRLEDRRTMRMWATMTLATDPILDRTGSRVQCLVGTPQLVVFAAAEGFDLERDGRALERLHDGGTNVMFAVVDAPGSLTVRPWERGVGAVDGCATGAAAAVVAAAAAGDWPDTTRVRQPGGTIEVEWNARSRELGMRGCARLVAEGRVASA